MILINVFNALVKDSKLWVIVSDAAIRTRKCVASAVKCNSVCAFYNSFLNLCFDYINYGAVIQLCAFVTVVR